MRRVPPILNYIDFLKGQFLNLSPWGQLLIGRHSGIRVETECQNCNFTQVRILGMDGRYSQILIDGDPIVSSLASVYGLEQIPEEMIDHIEVVKGGGSSIYGPGSVAGVINLVTRIPLVNKVKARYNGQWLNERIPDTEVGLTVERVNDKATEGAFVFASGLSHAFLSAFSLLMFDKLHYCAVMNYNDYSMSRGSVNLFFLLIPVVFKSLTPSLKLSAIQHCRIFASYHQVT
jgi:hypothetical protein